MSSRSNVFPPELTTQIVQCSILDLPADAGYISDHRPFAVILNLEGRPGERTDMWRLDIASLRDQATLTELKASVATTVCDYECNIEAWDTLKERWRSVCIAASRKRKRKETEQLCECLRRIRIVRDGNSQTQLMREYLDHQRERYHRLMSWYSRTSAKAWMTNRPISDPEVLRLARASSRRQNGSSFIERVIIEDGTESGARRDIERIFGTGSQTHFHRKRFIMQSY